MASGGRWHRFGRRPGLRARVTLAFGTGTLILSALLAIAVWTLVTRYLTAQREATTLTEAITHARTVQRALGDGRDATLGPLLTNLPTAEGTSSLLHYQGQWYASSLKASPAILPSALRNMVIDGSPARQRIAVEGAPALAIGLPLAGGGDAYFEIFPLAELDRTDRALGITLTGAAIATTALGLGTGRFASRRALRPLTEITEAAAAIARGDLDARLRVGDDPDLVGLARSFNATAAALQRRVVADARFAGDVSHELRTPMTTMLNSLHLLQNRRPELSSDAQEALELLAGDVTRFRRMIDDLLEISRADNGGNDPPREPVRIGELVRHAADAAAGRPITRVAASAAEVTINADKRRLEQVIANLVENADRHGGGCVAVTVDLDDHHVRCRVEDEGPGVPAEYRERIFERFARGPGRAGEPGAGLGLAIVERHVRWHGGRVHIEDGAAGGARFVVELPVEP
jgi:two-component system sensor histidine kinase MtrB